MVIACDIDNTLCNLQDTVITLFNKRFGSNYTIEDFNQYDVMSVLPGQDGVVMREMYGESGLYNKVKPYKGASDGLQKLINMGHNVYLVTDAIPKTYGEKVEFIKKYFPFIDDAHIICMKHKHLFKCEVLIEDNLSNLMSSHYYDRILMDQPWNRDINDYVYDINHCHNWNEIIAAINKINDGE